MSAGNRISRSLSAVDVEKILHLAGDELQALVEPGKFVQRFCDAEQGLVDPVDPFFLGNIPEDDHLTGGAIVFVVKNRAVDHDVQQAAVFGQPLGFESVDHLFFEQTADPPAGFRFARFGHEGNLAPLQLGQGPTENLFECGVQVRDGAVEVEDENRVREKLEKGPVAAFGPTAGLVLAFGELFCLEGALPGVVVFRHVPGDAAESDLGAVVVVDQPGGGFQDPAAASFPDDRPDDVHQVPAGAVDPVEAFKRQRSGLFVHELAEVAPLHFRALVAENAAKGVVEEREIALQVGFIKPVGHLLHKRPVPGRSGPAGRLCPGVGSPGVGCGCFSVVHGRSGESVNVERSTLNVEQKQKREGGFRIRRSFCLPSSLSLRR